MALRATLEEGSEAGEPVSTPGETDRSGFRRWNSAGEAGTKAAAHVGEPPPRNRQVAASPRNDTKQKISGS